MKRTTLDIKTHNYGLQEVVAYELYPGLFVHKLWTKESGQANKKWKLSHWSGLGVTSSWNCWPTRKEVVARANKAQGITPLAWGLTPRELEAKHGEQCNLWVQNFLATAKSGLDYPDEEWLAKPFSSEKWLRWDGKVLDVPTNAQVRDWMFDSVCEALDGCEVEADGRCPHGAPSWLIRLGLHGEGE